MTLNIVTTINGLIFCSDMIALLYMFDNVAMEMSLCTIITMY